MKLPQIRFQDLEKRAKKLGFEKIREARHGTFYKRVDEKGAVFVIEIQRHPNKVCPKGTLRSMIENSGYTAEEFFNK